MAIRNILIDTDPTLRKISRPMERFDERLWNLLDDMADTMYKVNGVGLAAPQVGILRRVVIVDAGEGLIELINPEITITAGMQEESEGCLSSPGEYGLVVRPRKVKVKAQDRHGDPISVVGEDLLARAFCHEIDHLNGVLFKDIAKYMLESDEDEKPSRKVNK